MRDALKFVEATCRSIGGGLRDKLVAYAVAALLAGLTLGWSKAADMYWRIVHEEHFEGTPTSVWQWCAANFPHDCRVEHGKSDIHRCMLIMGSELVRQGVSNPHKIKVNQLEKLELPFNFCPRLKAMS